VEAVGDGSGCLGPAGRRRRRLGPVGGVDGVSEGPERLNACTSNRTCVQRI